MLKSEESVVRSFGKLQISFHVGRDVAAKYTRESEGHAEESWVNEGCVNNMYRFKRRSLRNDSQIKLTPESDGWALVQSRGWSLANDFNQFQSPTFC